MTHTDPHGAAGRVRPRSAPQGLHPRDGRRGRRERPLRAADPHPLSARAERLPAHRPRQVHLPQLRDRPRSSAAGATCASTTPIPSTEDIRYVEAIKHDVQWLGFEWDEERYASDYFEQLYEIAEALVRAGKAYVDSQSEEEIREGRGTVTAPGTPSPYRDRSVEENLDLLRRMRAGEFPDGAHVLRAKIDMAHPNMIMRDPLLLRIRHAPHYRRGDAWCIYPLYDFAHGLSDAIEGITHSLCTLEFKDNRDIYDWLVREAGFERPPEQTEFARLELDYTVLSKRKLLRLVNEGHVTRVGRSAHADHRRAPPPRRDARGDPRTSPTRSAWRGRKPGSSSRRSSTPCATTSTCACRA